MRPAHQIVPISRIVSFLSLKRLCASVTGTTNSAREKSSSSSRIQNIQATSRLLVCCHLSGSTASSPQYTNIMPSLM